MSNNIPPFPLPHYPFKIDRARHWIATQGTKSWTASDLGEGAHVYPHDMLPRLVARDEVRALGDGWYQGAQLWPTWEDYEKNMEPTRRFVANVEGLYKLTLLSQLRQIGVCAKCWERIERWAEEEDDAS